MRLKNESNSSRRIAVMLVSRAHIEELARDCLLQAGLTGTLAAEAGWACGWLEACGYNGLAMLEDALATRQEAGEAPRLEVDVLGLDLHNASCVFVAPAVVRIAHDTKRVFLRNVRHGLYLLPFSVRDRMAIGCPVDPAFALGGTRSKDPYAEKLALAEANGIDVDDALWARLAAQAKDFSRS